MAEQEKKKTKKKSLLKKLIFLILFLGITGGGGFAGYSYFFTAKASVLPNIALDKSIMNFVFTKMPDIYSKLQALNDEIIIIKKEVLRIKKIGEKYPAQQKITDSQLKIWNKDIDTLQKTIEKIDTQITALYVSYRVDKETGGKLIEPKKAELLKTIEDALAPSAVLTDKLRKIEEAKTFITKLKEKAGF